MKRGRKASSLCRSLREAQSLASSASPIPLLSHSPTPSTLHIVLLPISPCVINYKRHKPPGLMPCHGCVPSRTLRRAKTLASLITPGSTVRLSTCWQEKSFRRALSKPKRHQWCLLFLTLNELTMIHFSTVIP